MRIAQAVEMADILRMQTDDPTLDAIATDILFAQQGQRGQLEGWLDAWRLQPSHRGPRMSGCATRGGPDARDGDAGGAGPAATARGTLGWPAPTIGLRDRREEVPMAVHQCYRCDLRFLVENEVRDHLVRDHGVDPETVEARYAPLPQGVHPHRRVPHPEPNLPSRSRE